MPFDALLAPPEPRTLAQALEARGIAAVGLAELAAHKEAQLARHQPSFWYRHEAWLPIVLVGSVGCMAASGGLTRGSAGAQAWCPTLLWMASLALLIVFGVFRVQAGAHWRESGVAVAQLARLAVPAEIAAVARLLLRDLPEAGLVLGELVRQEVVVDPYLLAVWDNEVVCLGIWDEGGVIAGADGLGVASWALEQGTGHAPPL